MAPRNPLNEVTTAALSVAALIGAVVIDVELPDPVSAVVAGGPEEALVV